MALVVALPNTGLALGPKLSEARPLDSGFCGYYQGGEVVVARGPTPADSNGTCGWTAATVPASVATNETSIRSTIALGDSAYVAVGDLGLILLSRDGGAVWTEVSSPLPTADNLVIAAGPGGSLWVGTNTGRILRSGDGGNTWSVAGRPSFATPISVLDFPTSSFGYAGGTGGVYLTSDGGNSWTNVSLPPGAVRAAGFYPPKYGWVDVGSNGTVYYTSDSGGSWTPGATGQPTARSNEITALGPTTAWMLGVTGVVFQTSNGVDWNSTSLETEQEANALFLLDPSTGWVVTDDANIFYTHDAGGCWDEEPVPAVPELYGVAFQDAERGVVVGSGMIWYTQSAGIPSNGTTECPASTMTSASFAQWYLVALGAGATTAAGVVVAAHYVRRRRGPPPPRLPGPPHSVPQRGRYGRRRRYREMG